MGAGGALPEVGPQRLFGYDRPVAFTVPESPGTGGVAVTRGERTVFLALRDYLPEDYLVYYDIRVKGRHPDFIVIGPDLGVVVLEVKDWRLQTIAATTADGVVINGPNGEQHVPHPIRQARDYILRTVDLLKQRRALRTGDRLCCGWGYGAVLPLLTTGDVQTRSVSGPTLEEALGQGLVLTADDLTPDRLLPRLRALLPPSSGGLPPLSPAQVNEIRGVLYPEIRIGWGRSDSEILQVMDREQERLARSLGDGHRLLRGVAGSGKTIALICRARHLREKHPDWRILVLCFNRVLADFLRQAIGGDDRLEVSTFHAWCHRELRRARIRLPPLPLRGRPWQEYWERVPALLLETSARDRAGARTYQAVLVDEGQDFSDDWYRVILRALDPTSDSLLIALDPSQNVYRRTISWRDIGVQVQGRSHVLRTNYRNTRPIFSAACRLIGGIDSHATAAGPAEEDPIVPDAVLRGGPLPEVHRHTSRDSSRLFALDWIRWRLARGVAPEAVLVLGLSKPEVASLQAWLEEHAVRAAFVAPTASRASVRLSTIHGAKGLDAAHVLLVGAHELEQRDDDERRRLLYIAMTRAREELCICYHAKSRLMAELEAVIAGLRSTP